VGSQGAPTAGSRSSARLLHVAAAGRATTSMTTNWRCVSPNACCFRSSPRSATSRRRISRLWCRSLTTNRGGYETGAAHAPQRSSETEARGRTKRTREYLTADEIGKLLTAAKIASRNPVRDYCALLLMFRHGLRVSELGSIKLSDIDVKNKTFHVNRLKDCDSGPHELYNGESQAVKAWLVERAKMKVPADCDSERRKQLSRITLWHMIGLVAKAAGLEHLDIHPHTLRHSTGYALVNKGTDIRIIQGYLGHKAISSTVRYTKLDSKRFAKLF
jgi:site-specific recombinase XerD